MNHYVVLTKVRKNGFIIHDPALGKRLSGNGLWLFTGLNIDLFNFRQRLVAPHRLLTDVSKQNGRACRSKKPSVSSRSR
ncbi:hypothetical protein CQA78_30100 [Klebsiella pneumoniae]|nr:hypothetical protein CQA78_30100 [Klebsiella pneumoniae]